MRIFLKILASVLLLFNGLSAVYGGWSLMMHPDGSGLGMPLELLEGTLFPDFFIPGLVLFLVNGAFSLVVLVITLLELKNYTWLIMVQGFLLVGWIVIQIFIVQGVDPLHIVYFSTGVLMMLTGWLLQLTGIEYSYRM
ncbi:hypothetical protein [Chitinophaga sp. XS-30]|uniref:hypothetical protein n=1 Tax=Chitinophaga sp. XS-30 TaxID=2604421 RepID=UPI0011DD3B74|nr:hypothetical protein [Chitinophaga sp. XS-30]QEH41455.1 hypothetical protein FW415_11400 [Chitinophaga sp. XS-30]